MPVLDHTTDSDFKIISESKLNAFITEDTIALKTQACYKQLKYRETSGTSSMSLVPKIQVSESTVLRVH